VDAEKVTAAKAFSIPAALARALRARDVAFEDSLRDYPLKHEPRLSSTAETSRYQWHGETGR
jgi:hypothetical protein